MRGSRPSETRRARHLRRNATSAEAKLWGKRRNRQLAGLKFVRQDPIRPHFADFVCRERKLIVEIDGATHSTDAELARDATRSASLRVRGYKVIRFSNAEVYENLNGVLEAILISIEAGADAASGTASTASGCGSS